MSLKFNKRERATILAALRHWQRVGMTFIWENNSHLYGYRKGESTTPEGPMSTDEGQLIPMSITEINLICEKLN